MSIKTKQEYLVNTEVYHPVTVRGYTVLVPSTSSVSEYHYQQNEGKHYDIQHLTDSDSETESFKSALDLITLISNHHSKLVG